MNDTFITLDVDWAPDFVIDAVAEVLSEHGTKATWFVTHASPAVKRLGLYPLFELGIHPNFLPGSSHGSCVEDVLRHMMSLVPTARSMRAHAVFQSGPLLSEVVRQTPIRVDSTTFLPEMPNIMPLQHLTPNGTLTRIPFLWSDNHEMLRPRSDWTPRRFIDMPGYKVFLFHPLHIFLNSRSSDRYTKIKADFRHLQTLTREDLADSTSALPGTGDFFSALLDQLGARAEARWVGELASDR